MTRPNTAEEWRADWQAASRAQRRAWARLSADERLRWLEDALRFAQQAGTLAAHRKRRAAATRGTLRP